MVKDIDVLICYELENRDLESALLLEHELQKRGLTARCAQSYWTLPRDSLFYRPKVILGSTIHDDRNLNAFNVYRGGLQGNKFVLINYHCEQMVTSSALDMCISLGKARDTYHLTWGEYFKDELLSAGISQDLIRITGSPRLDFFRKEFNNLNLSKEQLSRQFNLNLDYKWVLILGNFGVAFVSDALIQDYIERGDLFCAQNKEITKKTYKVFFDWIEEVASLTSDSNIEIIYRPHPSELVIDRVNALKNKYSNFHVIADLPVRDWIVSSNLCLTWTSTSSVEAAIAGVPVYSIRPFPVPEPVQIPVIESVPKITSQEELLLLIKRFADGEELNDNKRFVDEISPYYYLLDERTAIESTADLVEHILKNPNKGIFESRYNTFFSIRKFVNYYIKVAMKKLNLLKILPKYDLIPRDRTTKHQMEKVRQRLTSVVSDASK